ncbi:MAG TPA: hypothetical protein VF518_04465 [Polyangia bacterium]
MTPGHPHIETVEMPEKPEAPDRFHWSSKLDRHLAQAAKLASQNGVPAEAFAAAAWHAYLHASPDFAHHIEQLQFMAALEELRSNGRLAKA